MRVLLACHAFFPEDQSGTETLTKFLAHHYSSLGHVAGVLVPRYGYANPMLTSPTIEEEEYEGIRIFRMSCPAPADTSSVLYELRNPCLHLLYEDFLSIFKPDVIHIFHLMRVSGSLVEVARKKTIKVVFTPTDFYSVCPTYQLYDWRGDFCNKHDWSDCERCITNEQNRTRPLNSCTSPTSQPSENTGTDCSPSYINDIKARDLYMRKLFSLFDWIVPATKFMRETLQNHQLTDFAPIDVIPFGVPLINETVPKKPRQIINKKVRIGYCGTIRFTKGLHVLLNAIDQLPSHLDFEVKLYGMTLEHQYLRDMLTKIHSDRRIEYCGTFPNSKVYEVLEYLDVLVIPSVWAENTPLILYSALYIGTPVIASDTAGMSDILTYYCGGKLFPVGNSTALAECLTEVLLNPEVLSEWSSQIKPVPTSMHYARRLLEGYQQLLDKMNNLVSAKNPFTSYPQTSVDL